NNTYTSHITHNTPPPHHSYGIPPLVSLQECRSLPLHTPSGRHAPPAHDAHDAHARTRTHTHARTRTHDRTPTTVHTRTIACTTQRKDGTTHNDREFTPTNYTTTWTTTWDDELK